MSEIKKIDHEVIYLIPFNDEWVWCEDPAPEIEMNEKDAIKYVRADKLELDELRSLYIELTNCDNYAEDGELAGVFCPKELLKKFDNILDV